MFWGAGRTHSNVIQNQLYVHSSEYEASESRIIQSAIRYLEPYELCALAAVNEWDWILCGYQEHRPFRGPQYRCGFSGTELKIVFCSLFHLPSKHCMNLNPCIVAWEEWNMLSEEGKELIAVSVLGQCSCLLFGQLWSWLNSKLLFSKQEILDHAFSETGWSNKYMIYFPSRGLIPEMYNLWWELMFWGDTFSPSGNFTWSRSVSHV